MRCCGRITPAPCAPRACHNSGEPCRIRVEGCCALLLGGPPAPLPRLIRVKPCLFSFSLSPLFPFPASPFLLLLPLSPFPFSFPFHLSLSPCILHLTIPYLLFPLLLSPLSFLLSTFRIPLSPISFSPLRLLNPLLSPFPFLFPYPYMQYKLVGCWGVVCWFFCQNVHAGIFVLCGGFVWVFFVAMWVFGVDFAVVNW